MVRVAIPTENAPDKGTRLGQLPGDATVLSCLEFKPAVNLPLSAKS